MVEKILQLLAVTCGHKKLSQPFAAAIERYDSRSEWNVLEPTSPYSPSARAAPTADITAHYVVCLDCGRKFGYDWNNMRMVR